MANKFLLLLLLFTCICLRYSAGQYILQGKVINEEKQPVPYTTISLSKGAASNSIQADSVGDFEFKNLAQGKHQLSAYALGYAKLNMEISVPSDTMLVVSLNELEGTLKEVTVVGNQPLVERKADRIIYNVAQSVQATGSNGLDIIKKVPGIYIKDNMVAQAGRGSLGVMLNGRLLHLSDKALINYLKSFSSAQISKIEIITHPSAQYDAEGQTGLINIVTKQSTTAGFSGEINGSLSRFFYKNQPDYKGIKNYGDIDAGLGLNYNYNKWSLYSKMNYTAGRELWGYGIDVFYPEKHWAMKDTGEYRISTLNWLSGADYRISDRTTVGFEYIFNHHVEEGADYVRIPVYGRDGNLDSSLNTYATYYPIATGNSINFHLIQKLSQSGATLVLNADYFNFYRTDKSDLITQSYTGEGKLKENETHQLYDTTLQNIRIYTFKADAEIPASFAQLAVGGKASFINNYSDIYYYNKKDGELILEKDLSNSFRYVENTQALYLNGTKETGKWKFDLGLRSELTQIKAIAYFQNQQLNKTYLKLFPTLLASYKMNNQNNFSLSYNKRVHRPTFWNLNPYKTFMTAYTYVEGNPYLEPEYLTNIEVSHTYKEKLTSSLYVNIINNGFAQLTKPNDTGYYIHITTLLNFIKAYRFGIAESFSFQPFTWLETTNQANAYYTQVHADLPYVNGIEGPGFYINTSNTFFFNNAKTFRGAIDFWCQFPEIDHFGKSDTYYNLDIGLQVLALQKRLSIALHVNDLLQSSGSTVHSTVNNIKNTFTNFQIHRNIQLSASWQFGQKNASSVHSNTGNEAERSRVN